MVKIRNVELSDSKDIIDIYNYYVENTIVTFDETTLSVEDITKKIKLITKNYPFIILEENNEIIGYAYGSQYRPKPAYRYTVEVTIYIRYGYVGRGYGSTLFSELLKRLEENGFHIAIGVLGLPNKESQNLHEKFGFVKIGQIKEAGYKFDEWVDVGFWEKSL